MTSTTTEKPILLVEDNPHDADLTCIGFKRHRISNPIRHVKNGVEALTYLFEIADPDEKPQKPREDLPLVVVLDLKLPKVSGLEVLRTIRENKQTRQLPVIILTSSNEEQDTAACEQLGVEAYVQKPVSFEEFGQAVRQISDILLNLKQPSSASLAGES